MIDIVTQLKDDHRKVEDLFQKFEDASGKRDKQRVAERIIEELSLHASIEEQLVYPLLRMRDKALEDPILEALEEHHLAKLTLAELDEMSVEDERYEAKMKVLSEAIRHHIEEEESELLPKLEGVTSAAERTRIAETIPRLKELVPNHPHPMAPDTPPKNLFGGLLAKVLDTTKDLARLVITPEKGRARMAAKNKRRGEAARMMRGDGVSSARSGSGAGSSAGRSSTASGGRGSSSSGKGGGSRATTRSRGRVAAASGKARASSRSSGDRTRTGGSTSGGALRRSGAGSTSRSRSKK